MSYFSWGVSMVGLKPRSFSSKSAIYTSIVCVIFAVITLLLILATKEWGYVVQKKEKEKFELQKKSVHVGIDHRHN